MFSHVQIFLTLIHVRSQRANSSVQYDYFSMFLMIGTRHRGRESVITPSITSISASETLSKLPSLQSDRPCPAEMISPWKWVQVAPQLYLVRGRELNGICSLSAVTYNTILRRSNSPGTPGAAHILRAGDWASDWSRLHGGPRRGCPARAQGAGLGCISPLKPQLDLQRKICDSIRHSDSSHTLTLSGNPAGQLLRSAGRGFSGPGLEAARPSAADDHPGPKQDPVWVCTSDALRCQGGRWEPEGDIWTEKPNLWSLAFLQV